MVRESTRTDRAPSRRSRSNTKDHRKFAKVAAGETDDTTIEPADNNSIIEPANDDVMADIEKPQNAYSVVCGVAIMIIAPIPLFALLASSLGLGYGSRPATMESNAMSQDSSTPKLPESDVASLHTFSLTEALTHVPPVSTLMPPRPRHPAALAPPPPLPPPQMPPPQMPPSSPPPLAPTVLEIYVSMLRAPFDAARKICGRDQGVLAVPRNAAANDEAAAKLAAHMDHADRMWLGATDEAGEGSWSRLRHGAGTLALSFESWAAGQPDGGSAENCVEMWTTGKWNDAPCGDSKVYACEVPQTPGKDYAFECSPGMLKLLDAEQAGRPLRCTFHLFGADGVRGGQTEKCVFDECRELCERQAGGGRVAEPRTAAQRQFLARALRRSGDDSMWLGLTPAKGGGGGWRWNADQQNLDADEAAWAHLQPDAFDASGQCVEMWPDATWNDRPCEGDPFADKVCPCEVPV